MDTLSEGTVEHWAATYVASDCLRTKLTVPDRDLAWMPDPAPRALTAPGRPPEFKVATRNRKRPNSLAQPKKRAELLHVFFHHELQAAELMAAAILRFADAPFEMRRGFFRIARDEIRHMQMYAEHIDSLGFAIGDFETRDWFWERVPQVRSASEFAATMGIGFEGANLDHTRRFEAAFAQAGDHTGARLCRVIGEEEIPHVRFAAQWVERLEGAISLSRFHSLLPPPLSPMLMRGRPLDRDRRTRAGLPAEFLDELEAWQPT